MKKTLSLLLSLLLLFSLTACAAKGETKAFTLEVTHGDGTVKTFEIDTDAATLAEALAKEGLTSESASSPGLYDTIDGEFADWNDNEAWWCISKDGTALSTGMKEPPVEDGAHYEAVLTHGFSS